jgi:hypothetical protein
MTQTEPERVRNSFFLYIGLSLLLYTAHDKEYSLPAEGFSSSAGPYPVYLLPQTALPVSDNAVKVIMVHWLSVSHCFKNIP